MVILLAVLLGVILGGSGVWAATRVLVPAASLPPAPDYALVGVSESTIGTSVPVAVSAEWTQVPFAKNQKSGIVTGLDVADGAVVATGDSLYTVDLHPVVISAGEVPAFRAIQEGVEGEDVAQMQMMLAELGFYDGQTDGKVGSGTTSGIKQWQKERGQEATGIVALGDVIFVPTLPARIAFNHEAIAIGAQLSGGEPALNRVSDAPRFSVQLTESQSGTAVSGTAVDIPQDGSSSWRAQIGEQQRDEASGQIVALLGPETDAASICGEGCDTVPLGQVATLPAKIILLPEITGPGVPTAALRTEPDGSLVVVNDNGDRQEVELLGSSGGISIVSGIDVGSKVRLPPDGS